MRSDRRHAVLVLVAAALCGCAVGPDYRRPDVAVGGGYAPADSPLPAAGTTPGIALGQRLGKDWWQLVGTPELNALVQRALDANPTIDAARAALRVAQANVAAQRAQYFPTVSIAYNASRTRQSGAVPSMSTATPADVPTDSVYNFHTAQLNVAYAPDVFGGIRRSVQGLQAQEEYQRLQLRAARLTIAANVVGAAIQDALLREQIALVDSIIASGEQSLQIVQRQWRLGAVSHLDVALQEASLGQARQQLPPLRKQLEQNRDLLRALCGSDQTAALPTFRLDDFRPPAQLPVLLPSELVEQRPDILAAEAQLRTASAQIGVARAARLPQFTIGAQAGGGATSIADMFTPAGRFYSFVAGLAQPLFDAGALRQREAASIAAYDEAAAQYRGTVIGALQNVADALRAVQEDSRALTIASDNARTARTVLDLTQRQYGHGYLDRVALLNAVQADRQAGLAHLQARAALLADTVALFQAIGGSWEQAAPP